MHNYILKLLSLNFNTEPGGMYVSGLIISYVNLIRLYLMLTSHQSIDQDIRKFLWYMFGHSTIVYGR